MPRVVGFYGCSHDVGRDHGVWVGIAVAAWLPEQGECADSVPGQGPVLNPVGKKGNSWLCWWVRNELWPPLAGPLIWVVDDPGLQGVVVPHCLAHGCIFVSVFPTQTRQWRLLSFPLLGSSYWSQYVTVLVAEQENIFIAWFMNLCNLCFPFPVQVLLLHHLPPHHLPLVPLRLQLC